MTKQELKKRKKDMIKMRNNRYTLEFIGKKYGITKGRVWQIIYEK